MAETNRLEGTIDELHQILAWWTRCMTDRKNGGFYGRIDGLGQLHPEAEKGAVLNARILWTFSAAARFSPTEAYLETAVRAFEYLKKYFWDTDYGGVYWSLDYKGAPLNPKKQIYAQAFAIYGLSEYYLLTGDPESLRLAVALFDLLENKALDTVQNGYLEACSRNWGLLTDMRLSDKDANEAKTQNTHLHLLEAYANLLRAQPKHSEVATALKNLVVLFLEKFIDPQTAHLHLFFDENWDLKSDIVSFGHDIEASWLLWDAVQTLGDAALVEKIEPVCLQIAEATLREAVMPDGSVINERRNADGRLDTDRIWWVQAEAILGFRNAFRISADARFEKAAAACWRFCRDKMRDTAHGEWFWRISASGHVYTQEDKAGFWKCPYHNSRAMLYLY